MIRQQLSQKEPLPTYVTITGSVTAINDVCCTNVGLLAESAYASITFCLSGGQVGRQLRPAKHAAEDGVSAGRGLFSGKRARICDSDPVSEHHDAYGLLNI